MGSRWGSGGRVWLARELPVSPLPGPEKSQLVSGEAMAAELDGLEPDTEYTVHVRAHVAGVDGTPASVVVRTGEWPAPPCSVFLPEDFSPTDPPHTESPQGPPGCSHRPLTLTPLRGPH